MGEVGCKHSESESFCCEIVQVYLLMLLFLFSFKFESGGHKLNRIHLDHKCHFPGDEHNLINSPPLKLFIINLPAVGDNVHVPVWPDG